MSSETFYIPNLDHHYKTITLTSFKAEYNKNMIIRKEKDAMIQFSWSDFDQNICENLNPWLKNYHPKFLPIVHKLLLKIFKQF